jgi:hypothetical protein
MSVSCHIQTFVKASGVYRPANVEIPERSGRKAKANGWILERACAGCGVKGCSMEEEMEIYGMMDEPARFGSVEEWEQFLERVKRLPLDALEREPMIRRAQRVIEDIRRHKTSASRT